MVFFYDLLSSFFKEVPQAEFILKLKDEKVFLDLNFKSADLLKDYFSSLDINNNLLSSLKELKEDYNRLFIGPNKLLAPPWESVYRSSERLVFQSAALEVREYYLKMNLVHPEILVSPDDHISLELEFMSFLCNKALEFLEKDNLKEAEKYLEIEKSFLEEHLLKWIFDFTKDIEENARTLLYKGIAKFLREFIDFHIQNLSLKEVENV
ncbi:MAG: molecular chaperone TorD family protein [Armatimonadetes bacterium]|nr:molecular chaperone TorD family protein [Armatimonadota bacterium]